MSDKLDVKELPEKWQQPINDLVNALFRAVRAPKRGTGTFVVNRGGSEMRFMHWKTAGMDVLERLDAGFILDREAVWAADMNQKEFGRFKKQRAALSDDLVLAAKAADQPMLTARAENIEDRGHARILAATHCPDHDEDAPPSDTPDWRDLLYETLRTRWTHLDEEFAKALNERKIPTDG